MNYASIPLDLKLLMCTSKQRLYSDTEHRSSSFNRLYLEFQWSIHSSVNCAVGALEKPTLSNTPYNPGKGSKLQVHRSSRIGHHCETCFPLSLACLGEKVTTHSVLTWRIGKVAQSRHDWAALSSNSNLKFLPFVHFWLKTYSECIPTQMLHKCSLEKQNFTSPLCKFYTYDQVLIRSTM